MKEKVQLNLFGFPESLEVEVVTTSFKLFTRVLASTKLRIPGEGKRELSGNEIINQEALFFQDNPATFSGLEIPELHDVWREEFYHKFNIGVIQCKLEWVDSNQLKLPLTYMARNLGHQLEMPIQGWDENDPFVIDELLLKDKVMDENHFRIMKKMHNDFVEVTKEGEVK